MDTGRAVNERRDARGNATTAVATGASNYQRRAIPEGEVVVMGTDRRVYNVQCNSGNAWGHYSRECPAASSTVSSSNKKSNLRNIKRRSLKYILDTGSTHTTVNEEMSSNRDNIDSENMETVCQDNEQNNNVTEANFFEYDNDTSIWMKIKQIIILIMRLTN